MLQGRSIESRTKRQRQVTNGDPVFCFYCGNHIHPDTVPATVMGMEVEPVESNTSPSNRRAWMERPSVRIGSRHLMNVAILLMLPVLVAPTLNWYRTLFVDPDIWWHLANARILVEGHRVIWTDPYSFTVVGRPWINWEWLSELPFWFGFKLLGLRGIYIVSWLILSANILAVYARGYWKARSADASLWCAALAFVLMTVNSGPRTIEFSYLAMSAMLALLEAHERGNRKWIWLMPVVFCLWINVHGLWFAGVVLFALYIASGLFTLSLGAFQQRAHSPAERKQLIAVFAASLGALFVNPYGWHLLWNPVDMMLNQNLSTKFIAEWQPLDFSTLEGRFVIVAIGLLVITNMIRGRQWKLYELIFVFLAWYAAIAHVRFSYFAAVLLMPMLAQDFARAFNMDPDSKTIPVMNGLMAVGALVTIAVIFPREAQLKDRVDMMFPIQTIESLDPTWRTFNLDYVGGMMDFQGKPTFIDSRFDSFEHAGMMQEFRDMADGTQLFPLMAKYKVDHVLYKDDTVVAKLLQQSPEWKVIRREKAWQGEYILFEKAPALAVPTAPVCPPSAAR